ncbi:hypothetical protein ABPG74_000866 [Tetrahymena malaccensis]
MRCITNTNIIVDDFDFCKNFKKNTFIHFLTHFHQDHYEGLSPLWDYSPIYCSEISKNLILQKYPKIQNIHALQLNTKYEFTLNNIESLKVEVWFFDAHHIPGSVMILFKGYMGTIFHTGDFRFNQSMIECNPILFPPELRTKNLQNCSIQIDEMIYDNTYCNPAFNFPRADEVFKRMVEIIEKNRNKRVLIAMGALGKEDICIKLSEYFQTLLIIGEQKLLQLESIGTYRTDIFTTDRDQGFIEIIKKRHREQKIQEFKNLKYDFIVITTDFLMLDHKDPDGINYMVPYSLHSNFKEMESLVKAIGPSILRRLVLEIYKLPQFRKNQVIDNIKFYLSYVNGLKRKGEGGYSQFKQKYTRLHKLSDTFRSWMNPESQQELMSFLGLDVEPDRNLRKYKRKEISEEEQAKLDFIYQNNLLKLEKKESLFDISDRLKSTNNNKRIDHFFGSQQNSQQLQKSKKYESAQSSNSCKIDILQDPTLKSLFDQFLNSQTNLGFMSQRENQMENQIEQDNQNQQSN